MYDVIIIGGGPAGLTAALYARRADKSVLVIEKATFGGQITFSPKVENIPGFASVTGNEFAERLVDQVIEQGAEFEMEEVTSVSGDKIKTVIAGGREFQAKSVVIATGAKHRMLGLTNEENLVGNGISFCAVCDGAFFAGKDVAVIGGGNSALQEAIMLSDLAKKVYVVQNLSTLTGEVKLQEILFEKNNVEVITSSTVTAYCGESEITGIEIDQNGEKRVLSVDGVFLAVGLIPQNEAFGDLIELDVRGYAVAKEDCLTGCEGVFVAGDCRTKKIRQVATAAADGAIAALAACEYVDRLD